MICMFKSLINFQSWVGLCAAECHGRSQPGHDPHYFILSLFSIIRSWMRLQSMGSGSTNCPTPTLTRMRSSKSRPGSWRWETPWCTGMHEKSMEEQVWCVNLCFFFRPAFPLLWLAPTNWLRWKERRSEGVCTPGEWSKWRTQNTMTSSNCAPCLCKRSNQWLLGVDRCLPRSKLQWVWVLCSVAP